MSTALAPKSTIDAALVERVLLHGDLRQLTPAQKVSYYNAVCESVGLNPLTQPFQYLVLNGKEVLYARRDATEQLRNLHNVSIQITGREVMEDCYVVTARATLPSGRQDENIGAVPIGGLKGEMRANAMMKAETKAKRRVTLAICGLGMLDETEVESIPAGEPQGYTVEAPVAVPTLPPASVGIPPAPNGGGIGHSRIIEDEAREMRQPDNVGLGSSLLPEGAVLITKVEAGWKGSKAKGFLHHSGQLPGADGLAIYVDALVTLASECCQNHTPVWVELKTPGSGKSYVKGLRKAHIAVETPAPDWCDLPIDDEKMPF